MRTDPETGILHTYGPYHRWIGGLDCLLAQLHECIPYPDDSVLVKGHHFVPVSRGGRDWGNEDPLCWLAHQSAHTLGPTEFLRRWGIDLERVAINLADECPEDVRRACGRAA